MQKTLCINCTPFHFYRITILLHILFLREKIAIPSFSEMVEIDMINTIHRHRFAIYIDRFTTTCIDKSRRKIKARKTREREREKRKAKRIGKSGNFSRKLRRTSDNGGKGKRGMTFGEKVSDLRASIDVEG